MHAMTIQHYQTFHGLVLALKALRETSWSWSNTKKKKTKNSTDLKNEAQCGSAFNLNQPNKSTTHTTVDTNPGLWCQGHALCMPPI